MDPNATLESIRQQSAELIRRCLARATSPQSQTVMITELDQFDSAAACAMARKLNARCRLGVRLMAAVVVATAFVLGLTAGITLPIHYGDSGCYSSPNAGWVIGPEWAHIGHEDCGQPGWFAGIGNLEWNPGD